MQITGVLSTWGEAFDMIIHALAFTFKEKKLMVSPTGKTCTVKMSRDSQMTDSNFKKFMLKHSLFSLLNINSVDYWRLFHISLSSDQNSHSFSFQLMYNSIMFKNNYNNFLLVLIHVAYVGDIFFFMGSLVGLFIN